MDLHTITVLVPLRDDADAGAVAARIEALDDGPDSPFARSARTHFARLVVVPPDLPEMRRPTGMRAGARLLDLVTHLGRRQKPDHLWRPYLVFSAAFDAATAPAGDRRPARLSIEHEYAGHLGAALGPRAEEIWGACEGWPGVRDLGAFRRFLTDHALPARYVFAPPQVADVATVRQALARRQQVVDLAMSSAGASPAELRDRFLAVFAADGDGDGGGQGGRAAVATVAPGPPGSAGSAGSAGPAGPLPAQRGNGAAPADEDAEWSWWVRQDAHRWPHLPRVPHDGHAPDLGDVQGLTVGYPGHEAAAFVVLRVTHPERARRWLAALPVTTALEANAIIDAAKAGDAATAGDADAASADAGPPVVAVHVGFSHSGLAALGVTEERLAGFDRSFRAGMAARERALAPGVGTDAWRAPFAAPPGLPATTSPGADRGVHVLVHLSAPGAAELAPRLAETVAGATASGGFDEPWVQDAGRIADPRGDGRPAVPGERRRFVEHFGFADGISQPTISGVSRTGRALSPAELPTGELLLGYPDVDGDTSGATAPTDLRRNGTYLVFRKLEQDVPAFRALVRDAAARAGAGTDDVAAKLVGRRRDGTALTAAPGSTGPASLEVTFEDDGEGLRCPVGAHVRRANPRDSRPLGDVGGAAHRPGDTDRDSRLEARLVRRHLMVRRGIPYGEYLPEGAASDPAGPDADRGLLFVALVGDIGRQFEFVQTQWMSDGTTLRLSTDRDVFSGAASAGNGKFTIQGAPPVLVPTPRPVVTCRGGEYFLLPGLAALRTLTAPAEG